MALIDVNWNPSRTELRVFAGLQLIFFGLVFVVLPGIFRGRFELTTVATVVLAVSAVVALVGLIEPRAVRPVYVIWMAAVLPIGWVVSHVLIAVVFYLLMTPIGLGMRLLGRDPMERKFDAAAKSYWKPRQQETETKRYFRQF